MNAQWQADLEQRAEIAQVNAECKRELEYPPSRSMNLFMCAVYGCGIALFYLGALCAWKMWIWPACQFFARFL